ncbi:MAG TPA: hypothetical protein VEB63_08380 [Chitinophagaceae bacterium]|nr:hypothetical protein [Chitinophagaceae bacterium]
MKKLLTLAVSLFVLTIASVQAQRQVWVEMEEFHKVMGATFHPAEEGRLDPIKTRSGEMLEKAKAWKRSEAPAGYDKNAVNGSLKDLVKGARKLDKMVKEKASDEAITAQLTKLHDIFHEIMDHARKKST